MKKIIMVLVGFIGILLIAYSINKEDDINDTGIKYYNTKQYGQALEAFQTAIKLDDKSDYYINLGMTYLQLKNNDRAIDAFNKDSSDKKNKDIANFGLGLACCNNMQLEEAINYFNKSIKLNPKHVDSYFHKGYVLAKMEKKDEALELYNRALIISPRDERILNEKGALLIKKKDYDKALDTLRQAKLVNKNFYPIYKNHKILI